MVFYEHTYSSLAYFTNMLSMHTQNSDMNPSPLFKMMVNNTHYPWYAMYLIL